MVRELLNTEQVLVKLSLPFISVDTLEHLVSSLRDGLLVICFSWFSWARVVRKRVKFPFIVDVEVTWQPSVVRSLTENEHKSRLQSVYS